MYRIILLFITILHLTGSFPLNPEFCTQNSIKSGNECVVVQLIGVPNFRYNSGFERRAIITLYTF